MNKPGTLFELGAFRPTGGQRPSVPALVYAERSADDCVSLTISTMDGQSLTARLSAPQVAIMARQLLPTSAAL